MVREMDITTKGARETLRLGALLGQLLQPGDAVLLSGEVGAGKTTFTKGVANGIGVTTEVTSPTFTIVAEYEGRIPLVHMDLYRLYEEAENDLETVRRRVLEFGFDDYLEGENALLIEWPAAVVEELTDALQITVTPQPLPRVDVRVFHCKATGDRSWALLDEWVKKWLF